LETQIAYRFDAVTKKKIVRGFLLGICASATVGISAISSGISGKELALLMVSAFAGSVVNVFREYIKGE
jgi:ABC-type Fe3+-siderophore transport system permease subunit